ncbi:hypothetical protein PCL_10887 [Purpureocillium lilacinum]|uniref:Uncharacterized protein n=1 Tax=Purpureocillium lilacinum TaxID=33203 RepID=A0A2U3ECK4_PURLI|nr:hypothetical protein Purlil1_10226 [Purpureocillium lilacinum]PWI72264.1 hypothetical protein PCL_10887 [Purpureocillium lilacinum]
MRLNAVSALVTFSSFGLALAYVEIKCGTQLGFTTGKENPLVTGRCCIEAQIVGKPDAWYPDTATCDIENADRLKFYLCCWGKGLTEVRIKMNRRKKPAGSAPGQSADTTSDCKEKIE